MKALVILASALCIGSCSSGPEPIQWGKDACHTCKMTLMDKKFGGEIITQRGKVYKFDDMGCLIQGIKSINSSQEKTGSILAVDFQSPNHLVPAQKAYFLRDDLIRSPMGSNLAAFSNESDRNRYDQESKGTKLSWEDLLK